MLKTPFLLLALGLCASASLAQTSPYAGQQNRSIKSLSEQDAGALLAGEGMGLAKAAELNGYPGPSHVLELSANLQLSAEQAHATRALLSEHKAQARRIGAAIVEKEGELDRLFAHRQADAAAVARLTAEIGSLQAQLRAEHLVTHLRQAALLEAGQVARYVEQRGYGSGEAAPHRHRH